MDPTRKSSRHISSASRPSAQRISSARSLPRGSRSQSLHNSLGSSGGRASRSGSRSSRAGSRTSRAGSRTSQTGSGHHRSRAQKRAEDEVEREKIFFLIPRKVTITFGPYFYLGILDYRTERLHGLAASFKKCGAVVALKPGFRVNEVHAWHLEHDIFSCKMTDLQHGGDGDLDRLCMDAGRAFEKSVRRAHLHLKYRYKYETSVLKTGCVCEGPDPAFGYYEVEEAGKASSHRLNHQRSEFDHFDDGHDHEHEHEHEHHHHHHHGHGPGHVGHHHHGHGHSIGHEHHHHGHEAEADRYAMIDTYDVGGHNAAIVGHSRSSMLVILDPAKSTM